MTTLRREAPNVERRVGRSRACEAAGAESRIDSCQRRALDADSTTKRHRPTLERQRRRCLIVGATRVALDVIERVRHQQLLGLDILGYVCTPHDEVDLPGVRKVCTIDQLGVAAEGAEWDIVWIALPLRAGDIVARVLASLHANVADVEWLLDERDGNLVSPHMSNSRGYRTLELRTSAQHGAAKALKWFQDYLVALAMLAVAAPIMLAIAVGIMLTSRGPIFYRQHRVGLHGKPFEMLKFRSMPLDTERYTVEWGHSDGKVVTRFGRFIRWTNLDELPQLFNVLRGEMSIVGPRPERPQFVGRFKDQIPGYMQKHHVRPGMTGWAQIHGWRGDTDLMKRIEFDLYYINHWSVGLDLKIVFLTALLPIFKLGRKLPDGGEKSLPR